MDTNLATIQTVTDIQPIPNADAIEVVSVLGWKCVAKKGEFKIGDKCVYIAIDTVVPDEPRFEFLRKVHFRIRTIRLRKQLSQGIVFPIGILQPGNYEVGQDVTAIIGVKHYEKPIPPNMAGEVKGNFPSHTPKTDEIMVQSIPPILDEIRGKECYITVKQDGCSATFSHFNGEIDVCSRNLSWKESESNVFWKMFRKYNMENVLREVGNYSVQAEICGPGIQENKLGLKEIEMFVFSVYDIQKGKYLDYQDYRSFCEKHHLPVVPLISVCTFDFTMDKLIEMARGKYENGQPREGIVVRPVVECYSPSVDNHSSSLRGRMSFKVLNNDALEKE